MLKRKKAGLEDSLLEVMVQKEQADSTLAELRGETNKTASEEAELTATVEKLVGEIESELSSHLAAREEAVKEVPADVVSLYDKLREAKGGVGVAALRGDMCEGCHTKLPAREVEQVRAEGGLQRCDNCRRILVVT
jgi:predicted  nucleic acid-binding Zn-ribbon protein